MVIQIKESVLGLCACGVCWCSSQQDYGQSRVCWVCVGECVGFIVPCVHVGYVGVVGNGNTNKGECVRFV